MWEVFLSRSTRPRNFPTSNNPHSHGSIDKSKNLYPLRNCIIPNKATIGPGTMRLQAELFLGLQWLSHWELCDFSMGMGSCYNLGRSLWSRPLVFFQLTHSAGYVWMVPTHLQLHHQSNDLCLPSPTIPQNVLAHPTMQMARHMKMTYHRTYFIIWWELQWVCTRGWDVDLPALCIVFHIAQVV